MNRNDLDLALAMRSQARSAIEFLMTRVRPKTADERRALLKQALEAESAEMRSDGWLTVLANGLIDSLPEAQGQEERSRGYWQICWPVLGVDRTVRLYLKSLELPETKRSREYLMNKVRPKLLHQLYDSQRQLSRLPNYTEQAVDEALERLVVEKDALAS